MYYDKEQKEGHSPEGLGRSHKGGPSVIVGRVVPKPGSHLVLFDVVTKEKPNGEKNKTVTFSGRKVRGWTENTVPEENG